MNCVQGRASLRRESLSTEVSPVSKNFDYIVDEYAVLQIVEVTG